MPSYVSDGQFCEHILIVGRTEFGKTHFIKKLTVNKFLLN